MNAPREKNGGSGDTVQPPVPPAPSAGVRLEVAILSDQAAPAPVSPAPTDEPLALAVLVVAAETDLRCYVRECLGDRADLRVLEAASVSDALAIAAHESPELLVVDARESEVVASLGLRAIVIVDDVPRGARPPRASTRFLARPFTGEELVAEVGRLLT